MVVSLGVPIFRVFRVTELRFEQKWSASVFGLLVMQNSSEANCD